MKRVVNILCAACFLSFIPYRAEPASSPISLQVLPLSGQDADFSQQLPIICELTTTEFVVFHPEQWNGAPSFSVTIFGGLLQDKKGLIVSFDVIDSRVNFPVNQDDTIVSTDHCELWLCDRSNLNQIGISPGNFVDIPPYAYRWFPKEEIIEDNGRILLSATKTALGYRLSAILTAESLGDLSPQQICLSVLDVSNQADRHSDCMLSSAQDYKWKRCDSFNPLVIPDFSGIKPPLNKSTPKKYSMSRLSPLLPAFYYWKLTDFNDRKSPYRKCLMDNRGKTNELNVTKQLDRGKNLDRLDWKDMKGTEFGKPLRSPSGKWIVSITATTYVAEDECESFIMHISNPSAGLNFSRIIPRSGWGLYPMMWHPQKDYFIYYGIHGVSNCRAESLNLYDPSTDTVRTIGYGNSRILFDRKGEWILWEESDGCRQDNPHGGPTYPYRIVLYNIDGNANYRFKSESGEYHILGWAW